MEERSTSAFSYNTSAVSLASMAASTMHYVEFRTVYRTSASRWHAWRVLPGAARGSGRWRARTRVLAGGAGAWGMGCGVVLPSVLLGERGHGVWDVERC